MSRFKVGDLVKTICTNDIYNITDSRKIKEYECLQVHGLYSRTHFYVCVLDKRTGVQNHIYPVEYEHFELLKKRTLIQKVI